VPSQFDEIYDFMAGRFREIGRPQVSMDAILSEVEAEGFIDVWQIPRGSIANAMKLRGLEVGSGSLRLPKHEGEHFDPVETDYAEFKAAAKRIMAEAEYPLQMGELIDRTGLHAAAAPLSAMQYHLKQVGIFWLPGTGYWRHPQYTDPSGRSVSKRIRSDRVEKLVSLFEEHGWPISGKEAEQWTSGVVTSRFMTRYANQAGSSRIKGIGSGLYVPVDKAEEGRLPMSRNVVEAVAGIDDGAILDDKDTHRLFRIMLVAERLAWVSLKRSRTTRDRTRRQTIKVRWTDEGRRNIARLTKDTADEF
jgi:hypothetical protein